MDSYSKFEEVIEAYWEARGATPEDRAFWGQDGTPLLETDLLVELMKRSIDDGDTVRSGSLAKAVDMWVADELRGAGFDGQAIWPRLHEPRVLDPSVLRFIGSLRSAVAEVCCNALSAMPGASANVLGSTYSKQIDVGLSSWMTGPEILISTKTMGSSFGKNLSNRFEEAYGDAKNIKGRHPLATLGFFFLVHRDIVDESRNFSKALSMLEKLQMESDAYDATCLVLADWGGSGPVRLLPSEGLLPSHLSVSHFFSGIVRLTLMRAAPDNHMKVREKYRACDNTARPASAW